MNDLLELSRLLGGVGWVGLCVVAAAAAGLLVFDKGRKRHATELTVVPGLRSGDSMLIRDAMDGSDIDSDADRAKSA